MQLHPFHDLSHPCSLLVPEVHLISVPPLHDLQHVLRLPIFVLKVPQNLLQCLAPSFLLRLFDRPVDRAIERGIKRLEDSLNTLLHGVLAGRRMLAVVLDEGGGEGALDAGKG